MSERPRRDGERVACVPQRTPSAANPTTSVDGRGSPGRFQPPAGLAHAESPSSVRRSRRLRTPARAPLRGGSPARPSPASAASPPIPKGDLPMNEPEHPTRPRGRCPGPRDRARGVRDPACHRRPGHPPRANVRRAARTAAPPHRGRARAREDPDDQDDRSRPRRHVPAHAVHSRPRPLRPRRHARVPARRTPSSTPSAAPSSATSSSPTRSTARRRRCSRPSSR